MSGRWVGMISDVEGGKKIGGLARIQKYAMVNNRETAIKYVSFLVLVIQNAAQVLVMRYVRTRPREMFLSTVAVFFTEIVKVVVCILWIVIQEMSLIRCLKLMYKDIVMQPIDTLKVCVPAVVYVVQNNLLYIAVSNLPAATYMVLYQLKILTAALFTVTILRRNLSLVQWLALVILFGGAALVQLDEQKAKEVAKMTLKENLTLGNDDSVTTTKDVTIHKHITEQSPMRGFIAVLVACILSGFAGIVLEKILKDSDVSLFVRNVQLSIVSLPVGLANVFIQDSDKVFKRGMMVGFDIVVWGMVILSALGGLTVSVVIKYADNILKAFATSISIIVACIASAILFAFRPSILFVVGTILAIGAVFLYSLFPYKKNYSPASTEPPLPPPPPPYRPKDDLATRI